MNVTLKDVPPELHERIKEAATNSGRSLNRQIIFTLEASLGSQKIPKGELVRRIQQRRGRLGGFVDQADVASGIQDGRA
jgi:hypothetical protein